MGYKIEKVSFDKLKECYKDYPYALIYMMSELVFSKTEELKDIIWDECLEARFFGENGEIHLFQNNGDPECIMIEDNANDADVDTLVDQYKLNNRFLKHGSRLLVKRYIGFDEDGQAFIKLTRLADVV